jgi:hypothetical protein
VTLLLRAEAFAAPPIAVSGTANISALQPFEVSDQRSAYFTATAADWAARADAQAQFAILGSYLQMAGVALPSPITDNLLSWMARFLDQAPRKSAEGPWIATAYPRLVSPLPVAPNDAGQITYLHLVTDAYAHALRYYVRPRGRYDDLWQAVASSPLYREALSLSLDLDPTVGGLDVVLDRVAEVAQPLILSSRRIDALATIAQPSPPGAIWEVIVAKHPEQTLTERNWTLARQLAWGQLACTLMRTFAFQTPLVSLRKALVPAQYDFNIQYVENLPAASLLPSAYPVPETERLDFSNTADLRAIDLPQRIATFSQGALVLQYRAMPYFYKQRFVVAAQAGRVASQPAALVQRDFEYRSPMPHIIVDAIDLNTVRFRLFRVQLASYWECSPDATQAQWSIEAPVEHDAPPAGTKALRKYSSLPETAVVYQLVLNRGAGVSEAIVEFYFDPSVPAYAQRQFSPTLSVTLRGIEVPDMLIDRQAPMFLDALMSAPEVTRIAHLRALLAAIPDFGALASKPGAAALDGVVAAFLARWFPLRAISAVPVFPATADWQAAIETRPADQWVVAWDGNSSAALDTWAASVDPVLAARIQSLKTTPIITIPPFLAPEDIPVPLRHSLTVTPSQVTWTGATTDATLAQFDTLLASMADKSPAKTALAAIRAKLNTDLAQPAGAATFDGPLPDKAGLATLLGNPLTHLDISGTAGAWQIFNAGINLGEPAENLLNRLATAIPDSNDNVRKALTAVFTAVAKFTVAAAIPGVPAALADNVLFGVYVLHLKGPIPSLAVFNAAFIAKPDQASMARLLGDVAQEQAFSKQLAAWTSEEAVTSRSDFAQSATWQNRIEFPVPEACQLRVDGSLTADEVTQLLAVRADSSFNDALRQLASGQPTARATLGLEQIFEIAPNAGVPTAANRNLTWRGPLRPNQDAALLRWIQVSAFAGTFSDLRAKLTGFTFHADFDPTGEYPRQDELAPTLAGRVTIGRGTLDWTSLLLDVDQQNALQALASDASFGASFHTAINGLVDAVVHSASVVVAVREADWAPRPKPGDVLPKKLLIGNARIQWFGLMTRADALGLQSGQSDPEKDAIARLFADASSAGLAGAEFAARGRLASAAVETSPLDTTL